MNQLKQTMVVRVLSYVLVVAFVSGITGFRFASPAAAQALLGSVETFNLGAIDFINDSGIQGDILGRMATDAVVLEMSKTNRYEVSITRSQMKAEMEKLDLRPPLSSVGMSKLGEALSVDAMLQGAIKKVTLSGVGSTRSCSVKLMIAIIDQASGQPINGAYQTGNSFARVGYTADDDTLLAEAINNAAYLCVRTMMTYVIPEATVLFNIENARIMINSGVKQGIKPGMKLIVLRKKEIIGYAQVQEVTTLDSIAKITKIFKGVLPEDKVRGIYDMPTNIMLGEIEELPTGPPIAGVKHTGALKKIAKFILGAAIVYFTAQLFRSGRGEERAPSSGTSNDSNTIITWDTTTMNHGRGVWDLQILRDDYGLTVAPFVAIRDTSLMDAGRFDIRSLYGTDLPRPVTYYSLDLSPSTSEPTDTTFSVPAEAFGTTHSYQVRMVYETMVAAVKTYLYSTVSNNIITITAIQPVLVSDLIFPAFDPMGTAPSLVLSDLKDGTVNFRWNRKNGANVYYMVVEPIAPGTIATWDSRSVGGDIYETGPTIELTAAQRTNLLDFISRSGVPSGTVLQWRVYCRNTADTSPAYTKGEAGRFEIGEAPPPIP